MGLWWRLKSRSQHILLYLISIDLHSQTVQLQKVRLGAIKPARPALIWGGCRLLLISLLSAWSQPARSQLAWFLSLATSLQSSGLSVPGPRACIELWTTLLGILTLTVGWSFFMELGQRKVGFIYEWNGAPWISNQTITWGAQITIYIFLSFGHGRKYINDLRMQIFLSLKKWIPSFLYPLPFLPLFSKLALALCQAPCKELEVPCSTDLKGPGPPGVTV